MQLPERDDPRRKIIDASFILGGFGAISILLVLLLSYVIYRASAATELLQIVLIVLVLLPGMVHLCCAILIYALRSDWAIMIAAVTLRLQRFGSRSLAVLLGTMIVIATAVLRAVSSEILQTVLVAAAFELLARVARWIDELIDEADTAIVQAPPSESRGFEPLVREIPTARMIDRESPRE